MRISINASILPGQLVGPIEKGMKAAVLCVYFSWELKILGSKASRWASESQRSGKNESGRGEK